MRFTCKELWRGVSEGGYAKHRIPGMIVTAKGTLIVYNEARYEAGDWSMMDVFCQRSTDGGGTFGERIYLARGSAEHGTVNNPVMMQDRDGRIHFLYCEDYGTDGGRILRRYSDDDGLTWSDPIDITAFTDPQSRNCFAFGPGHGICTNDGTLLVPVWMVPKFYESPVHAHAPSVISTFYSRDNGESWSLGERMGSSFALQSPNETVATLLSDGRVYLNVRCANYWRATAISPNGYSDWSELASEKGLIDPKCFGSVASFNRPDVPFTVLFANCESKTERKNVVVKGSTDNGKTWMLRRVIDAERGGYVEINVDNKSGNIYVLYEDNAGESDYLAVFDYEWLCGGGDEI